MQPGRIVLFVLFVAALLAQSSTTTAVDAELTIVLKRLTLDPSGGVSALVRFADGLLVVSVNDRTVAQRAAADLHRVAILGSPGDDRLTINLKVRPESVESSELELVFEAGDGDDHVEVRGLPVGATLEILGGADDDWLWVHPADERVNGRIVFDGQSERTADGLSVIAAAPGESARYVPDPAVYGNGIFDLDRCQILFMDLEPVDASGFGSVTISPAGADDLLTVAPGFDAGTGIVPALVVGGTTGGVVIEALHAYNNTTLVINTSANDGDDTVTISGADNAHANNDLQIMTGSGADVIDVAGPAVTMGDQVYSGPATLGANLTAVNLSFDNTVTPSGILALAGNLSLEMTSDLTLPISGATAGVGYSQLGVTGTVSIAGALSANVTFTPADGDNFTIINNDGADPVVGTFSGLPEGAVVATAGMIELSISYAGGDGNDVVLSATMVPVELMTFSVE